MPPAIFFLCINKANLYFMLLLSCGNGEASHSNGHSNVKGADPEEGRARMWEAGSQ